MKGLLVDLSGEVQVVGNADPVEFIEILAGLLGQLRQVSAQRKLEALSQYSPADLAAELKKRAAERNDDTNLSE